MNTFTEKRNFRLYRNKGGQALVELAIVLPLLLLLVCGIIEFGRAMYIKNTLTSAARAGVRVAVVTSGYTSQDYTFLTRSSTDKVQQKIYDCLNYVNKSAASATLTCDHNPAQVNDTVTATVRVPFNTIAAGILKMLKPNNTEIILVGRASMRYE